jgi:pyridoxamine 5'-phosphate oxidase
MLSTIADIRKEYKLHSLSENEVDRDPIRQFTRWWQETIASEIDEANAMTLSTASAQGKPFARIVLLKGYDNNGFVFFTNYESKKGKEIGENPRATLLFFWKELERQVRIEGTVEKVNEKDSDAYFSSRPLESRIGAWASPQSRIIESRETLEANVQKIKQQFPGENIPRPPHWGGYIVVPETIEFWQGRPNRLHDRILYTLIAQNNWSIQRLAP